MTALESDVLLAERLATGAGKILLDLQQNSGLTGKELGKAGDLQANAWLMNELRTTKPDDAILSEEETDSTARLSSRRVWIIDPLDGTREYGESRTDWAVHVALAPAWVALAWQAPQSAQRSAAAGSLASDSVAQSPLPMLAPAELGAGSH